VVLQFLLPVIILSQAVVLWLLLRVPILQEPEPDQALGQALVVVEVLKSIPTAPWLLLVQLSIQALNRLFPAA